MWAEDAYGKQLLVWTAREIWIETYRSEIKNMLTLRSVLLWLIDNLTFISLQKLQSNIPSWRPVIMEWLRRFTVLHSYLPPCFQHYFSPPPLPKWARCAANILQQALHGQQQISNIRQFPLQISKPAWEVEGALPMSPVTNAWCSTKGNVLLRHYEVSQHRAICCT